MNSQLVKQKIKNRKVFYLSGYDPRAFRFYYGNLKSQSKKFSDRENIEIHISEKTKISEFETCCTLENTHQGTHTEYSFLHWEDLVKKSWTKSFAQLFFIGLKSYVDIFTGFHWRELLKLPRSPIITLFYPFLTLVIPPLAMTGVLSCLYAKHYLFIIWFILSLVLWIKMLPRINSLWLLRFFIFNNQNFIHYNFSYDKRAEEFAKIIQASFDKDYDEILLICHSNGSIASMPILNHMTEFPERFKVLSFGHCLPLITINTKSQDYIRILECVMQKKIKWFDIGFPPDGACYAKTHPFITYKGLSKHNQVQFKSASAQFFKYYSSEYYENLRKDKFRLHFDYLCTPDKPSPTEFIDILTSHKPLETRF